MDYSGVFISMPVMRTESARDDDERSRRERKKQLDQQLPRMRIAEKNRSEQILADAMRTGSDKKNLLQRASEFPQPSTAKLSQKHASELAPHEPGAREGKISGRTSNESALSDANKTKSESFSRTSQDFYDLEEHLQCKGNSPSAPEILSNLEERLQRRGNPPPASEILSIMKKLESKVLNQNKTERESTAKEAEQADLLCSLDFIEGYVGALANPRATHAAIAEVIGSLRSEIMMPLAGRVPDIKWQQEGILELTSDTDAKCTLTHDAAGHTQVIIEVNQQVLKEKAGSSRVSEPTKNRLNRDPAPGDDTLPLAVQRSV